MTEETWNAVDRYLMDLFASEDAALVAAREDTVASGMPPIQVSATQGKLLAVLAQACGARKILEIGTLGGYSAIWLGRALPPGGRLTSLEINPEHAVVAERNLARAGLADKVTVRVGPAVDSLAALLAEGHPPFDFVFIDADKQSYVDYLEWSLRLTRPGGLIVADNVIRKGKVADPESGDGRVRGIQRFLAALASDPRLNSAAMQTLNNKGYDGMAIAVVK